VGEIVKENYVQNSNYREKKMKKLLFVALLLSVSLIVFGSVISNAGDYPGGAPGYGGKATATTDKMGPDLKGIAYMQTHGGHVTMVDLATGEVARIVHEKPADALTLSADKKTLYVFSLDGHAKEINLESGNQTEWMKLGNKHCGSNIAPDGSVWVSDMKDGKIYIYDPKSKKLADSFPVSKSICGVFFSKDGKTAYASDMPGGFISIIDVAKRKVTGKIEGVGNFLHRARVHPNGKEIWQAEGNELKGGKPYGVGYAEAGGAPGGITIVDAKSGKIKDFIITGGNVHDVDFTPDGKYAIAGSRQVPERDDSALIVIDTKTKRVVKMYSACKKCHGAMGYEIPEEKDKGRPFLCAVEVDWTRDKIPASAEKVPM
jgi:tricorn protease-like protein